MRAVENLVGLLWIAIWAMWQLVTAFRIWRAFAHRDAASG
jgi:hypothetical protein